MVCVYTTAAAWGVTGHRVIGRVAEQHLTKKARKAIADIIGQESLAWWANWPDFIKSDTNWRHASAWHYVNLPVHTAKDEFVKGLRGLAVESLYSQIPKMLEKVKNKSLPQSERRDALAFLIHFMGDLHQPLHVGQAEDQGGNKVTVYWFDKKTNLHSVWDTYLVDFQEFSFSEYASEIDRVGKAQAKALQAGSLEDWFYESHAAAADIYDSTPNESKLSYPYNFKYKALLDQQLLKGGLRLAALLNQAFQ